MAPSTFRDWQPLDDLDPSVKEWMLVSLLHVGSLWEINEAAQYTKHTLHASTCVPEA
ncbi:hypothetical protein B0H14DRAFT_3522365 [Mycena olivaceomarginata]|nr:hypothetical protein B0H14DRAFT_3522365 [Mycena olivaceomarginata]